MPFEIIFSLDLNSNLSSDSDANPTSVPHCTIDEILDDSTSVSPSSSPRSSSALSEFLVSDPRLPQSDVVFVASVKTEAAGRSSQLEEKEVRPGLNLYSRARSDDFPDDYVGRILRPSLPGRCRRRHDQVEEEHREWKLPEGFGGCGGLVVAELGERSEGGSKFNEDSNAVGSETRAMSSNEVEEDFGGELRRRDEVLEGEREVDEVSFGNAGALENANADMVGKRKETSMTTTLDDLIEKAGGCAVVDGGLATQLEKHGAAINDTLWSAVCLIKDPDLIKRGYVHLEYLEAGADVLVTSSYQATIPGFLSKGLSIEEGESLLKKSVTLAVEARNSFWEAVKVNPGNHHYNRALVAASIGSYGAYLADGSEYSGDYGPNVDLDKLKDFHRRRLQVLVEAGPDLLAFETIPNKLEAQACIELLEEENIQLPSWICFSSVDGEHAPSGESFKECLDIINRSNIVNAVGINCAPPHFTESLICKFQQLTSKAIVVYPNSGEIWDGKAKRWLPSKCFDDDKFECFATRWRDSGAKLIGGCCRTTPSTIQAISKVLKGKSQ